MKSVIRVVIAWGLLVGSSAQVFAAESSFVVPGKWFVELAAPPAVAYDGGPVAVLQDEGGGTAGKRLAPTSPRATGRQRYDAHTAEVAAYTDYLAQQRESVLKRATDRLGRTVTARRVYAHVFNGFEASLSAEEADEIARLPGVRSVQPVMAYKLELDAGPELIGARRVHAGLAGLPANGGEGTVIGIIDSGINWEHEYFSDDDLLSGHVFTNPYGRQLGECSKANVECNDKLVGVYDFTIEGTDGKDPEGHGTHVASIAAGVPLPPFSLSTSGSYRYDTTGVAPHANIISYKVCYKEHPSDEDLSESCEGSAIRQAWEQAVIDGVDVVNYSIGSEDPVDPWASAIPILNMWEAGIPFVTSAGNSGPGSGTIGSPANAPWAFAVGSTTHGRQVGSRATVAGLRDLVVTYGSGPALSSSLTAPLIAADDVAGSNLGCNAFPAASLKQAIVLIERGDCTFADKVGHAFNAGAAGVLVYNNVYGPPIVMGGLEGTSIPAAMMSRSDGVAVRAAMADQSHPGATLQRGGFAAIKESIQDFMSDFSSRGPNGFPAGVMKPNVVAPGSNIVAGWHTAPDAVATASGTSMASPHVAGAVALLKALHQDWTPAMLQSALETTAETLPLRNGENVAGMSDRGSGRVRVDRAARAGLYLPLTRRDFERANPATGGDPAKLNLPGIWDQDCLSACSFTRKVRAIGSGTWEVEASGDVDISVTPQRFSLAAGETQTLNIKVETGALFAGSLGHGQIELRPTQGDFVSQQLSVGVQVAAIGLSSAIEFKVDSNRGRRSQQVTSGPLPEPVFRTSDLVTVTSESFLLPQDSSRDDPYSGDDGRKTFLIDVPQDALLLIAEIVQSAASDIDLFVGRDDNGNGRADESEEVCKSTTPGALEQCLIESPAAGTWWVLVQNWKSSVTGRRDPVELEMAAMGASDGPGFSVTGPGFHPGGELELTFSWDEPAMLKDQRRVAALELSSSPDAPGDLGVVPVYVTRTADNAPQPTALFHGETRSVVLPGASRHDLLFVDVPPSARRLEVTVKGDSRVEGELHRLDFARIKGHAPATPPAPTGTALSSGRASSAGFTLEQAATGSSTLTAGRYYVVLENDAADERRVEVAVNITESAAAALPRFGLWSARDRNTYQGFEWAEGGAGLVVWYSYDDQGLPVFYNAMDTIEPDRSTWSADLLRTTSIGVRNNFSVVGHLGLTAIDDDDMIVSWRIHGAHGSERLTPDSPSTCPQVGGRAVNYTGHWAVSGEGQGGTTMIVTDSSQAQVRYYFDQLGVGRWVITSDSAGAGPLAEQLDVLDVRGFCPGCEPVDVSWETVGSYSRVFEDEYSATEILEFESRPPLNQSFATEVGIQRLTARRACP